MTQYADDMLIRSWELKATIAECVFKRIFTVIEKQNEALTPILKKEDFFPVEMRTVVKELRYLQDTVMLEYEKMVKISDLAGKVVEKVECFSTSRWEIDT